jgi:hypothetical protein
MDWFYAEAGQQRGPVSEAEFQRMVQAGTIRGETLVWREGMANWQPYRDVAPSGGPPPPFSAPGAAQVPVSPLPAGMSGDARQTAMDKLNGPSIGLIVTAVLGFLFTLLTIVATASGVQMMPPNAVNDPNVERLLNMLSGGGIIIEAVIRVVLSLVVLLGAIRMRRLTNYGLAVASAIISLIPCSISPCCCVGIPIGIWALVILNKSEVKSQFL